jgi:dihydroorotase
VKTLITNGHLIDPSQGFDGAYDLLIEKGRIVTVAPKGKIKIPEKGIKIIDASNRYVIPGLVDMHVHLREPGFEYKETISTGTHAAVRGGFTSVCCMPNTSPVNDNAGTTEYILKKAQQEGMCAVYPIGAVTKGQMGEELAEFGMMLEEGCVAFSDDGRPVMNSRVMRRALEYSRVFGVCIISHSEDLALVGKGVMNEGRVSQSMGLAGIPKQAEETMVYRDVALAELTGGRVHIAHVSTEGSVRIIREAKSRGINVTAETCPHYFSVTEKACEGFNANAKVSPPLRTDIDIEAIKKGLSDGTLDVIATDHAPHHRNEKQREFDQAPPGISGLETALGLSLNLVREGIMDMTDLVEKMCLRPSLILGLNCGTLSEGAVADVTIVDTEAQYTVDIDKFLSKGKNTPFAGWTLKGRAVATIVKGKVYKWE